jgi:uncharacterized DUF497 family protein
MSNLTRIEWDENKNLSNQRKHGVGFEEAAQVFLDPLHISRQDRIEGGELRWQTCGFTAELVLLLVAHTATEYDEDGREVEVIRIISARRADRKERQRYEENG